MGQLKVLMNPSLATLSLPLLEAVETNFVLDDNAALADLTLPSLTHAGMQLYVKNNASMTAISLPVLEALEGHLSVAFNPALVELDLPVLTEVGLDGVKYSLTVTHNDQLAHVAFPALTRIHGDLRVNGNDTLASFTIPLLASSGRIVAITDNLVLAAFELPLLTEVGSHLWITGNPTLAQCLVDALVAQLDVGGDLDLDDADPTCTCDLVDGTLEATCP
jgi:hypothetical protein